MTTISIAMCTFNGAQYLKNQLDSLAAQSLQPTELHVGDDGSTDSTLAILEEFASRSSFPVHVTVNQTNLGYGENFVQTALRCKGEWIAFCDQDDFWHPHKLQTCAEVMSVPEVRLVMHNCQNIDEDGVEGAIIRDWPALAVCPRLSLWPGEQVLGFCQVFHRDLIHNIPVHDRRMPWVAIQDAHDVWISLVAGATGTIVKIGEPLAIYRRHQGNTSLSIGKAESPFWADTPEKTFIATASALLSVAEVLEQLRIIDASTFYKRAAKHFEARSRIYAGPGRLTTFVKLLFSGCYNSGSYCKFGRRALIADLRAAFS